MARLQSSAGPIFSIGEVLKDLRTEFPNVTISKIRFLEAHGLIAPARTPSGYRKFTPLNIERLRYILRMQRDYFLPLRVIQQHLDAMDRGLEPPEVGDTQPKAPRTLESTDALARMSVPTNVRLTKNELASNAGTQADFIDELVQYGIINVDSNNYFDGLALNITKQAQILRTFGLQARHLKTVSSSASREVDLFAPILKSARSGKNAASSPQAEELTLQIAAAIVSLHELLLRQFVEQQS
ncbi:MAG: MerR family DNA-binding transcriptional regulator [Actinobacteria bacterium]|uniref:Unannotated protein n=1 Tax=freshwater metagenome TaxID=449393 RepID=A0A6J5YSU8_9ZZZZ|nr:MerR family DNA-binding transcriptional regulator [Actinomycetota bacterium]